MRLYALILALAVFYARAATIPVEVEQSKPVDNDRENIIESNLRNEPEAIPVAVVEDLNPTPKRNELNENSNDYVPNDGEQSINIKRLEIDLKNPGPPQRQEHETQNPEFYVERDYFVSEIKQKLLETENIFQKSVSEVNKGFVNWVPNSEHLKVIQNDLKEMQNRFLTQISDLNKSLQTYLNPHSTKAIIADPETTANLKEVENRLKVLEANFKTGVETLSEGVKALETAKADGESPAPSGTGSPSPAPSTPSNEQSNNPLSQLFQFFTNGIGDAINNVQNAFQSFTNPSNQNSAGTTGPPASAQSDETTQAPSWLEMLQTQFTQIFNIGQPAQGQGTSSNPLLQIFQNNPFQGLLNQFSPQTNPAAQTPQTKPQSDQPIPPKPVQPQSVQPQAVQQPQTVQPQPVQPQAAAIQPEAQPQPIRPEAAEPPKETAATQTGPIRQIVQNNPIVKSIVQRIQSISNPEKPKEKPEQASSEKSEESIKEKEPVPTTKGHGGGSFNNVNGGATTGGVDNDSDGIVVKNVPIEKIEEVQHKCQKEKEVEAPSDKEEKQTVLPDKTE